MFPAKYQPNCPQVLEKKSFERFLSYMGIAAILNFGSESFKLFFVPLTPGGYI